MDAIRIRTRLESDTPYLPELKPLIGKAVEITVIEEGPLASYSPGHGNWDAATDAVKQLISHGGFDFEAIRTQNEMDLLHAEDHLK